MANKPTAWGRVRRPKNILGREWTTVKGNHNDAVYGEIYVADSAPSDDLAETISGVSVDNAARTITFTTANSLGTDVFDDATGEVITDGTHRLLDGKLLPIISTTNGANQTVVGFPRDITPAQADSLTVAAVGTLRQRSKQGARTENARFLHLYLANSQGENDDITVYGYNYTFGKWAPLQIPMGEGSTATAVYADAKFRVNQNSRMVVIPINGVDKVFFVVTNDDSDVTIGAAISTF